MLVPLLGTQVNDAERYRLTLWVSMTLVHESIHAMWHLIYSKEIKDTLTSSHIYRRRPTHGNWCSDGGTSLLGLYEANVESTTWAGSTKSSFLGITWISQNL